MTHKLYAYTVSTVVTVSIYIQQRSKAFFPVLMPFIRRSKTSFPALIPFYSGGISSHSTKVQPTSLLVELLVIQSMMTTTKKRFPINVCFEVLYGVLRDVQYIK